MQAKTQSDNSEDIYWKELKQQYEIQDVIGKGAFGTVVRAKNLKTE